MLYLYLRCPRQIICFLWLFPSIKHFYFPSDSHLPLYSPLFLWLSRMLLKNNNIYVCQGTFNAIFNAVLNTSFKMLKNHSQLSFFSYPHIQPQRSAMEYKKISKKSTTRIPLWRGSSSHHTMVGKFLVAHRLAATKGGHGSSSSKYPALK